MFQYMNSEGCFSFGENSHNSHPYTLSKLYRVGCDQNMYIMNKWHWSLKQRTFRLRFFCFFVKRLSDSTWKRYLRWLGNWLACSYVKSSVCLHSLWAFMKFRFALKGESTSWNRTSWQHRSTFNTDGLWCFVARVPSGRGHGNGLMAPFLRLFTKVNSTLSPGVTGWTGDLFWARVGDKVPK